MKNILILIALFIYCQNPVHSFVDLSSGQWVAEKNEPSEDRFTYDAKGRISSWNDFSYHYEEGRTTVQDSTGRKSITYFNSDKLPVRSEIWGKEGGLLVAEKRSYDASGRIIETVTDCGQEKTRLKISYCPDIVEESLEIGGEEIILKRTLSTVDEAGITKESVYNSLGELIETTEYDETGKITRQTDDQNRATHFSYNAQGELNVVKQGNKTVSFVRDPLGRVIERVDPLGRKTLFEYDDCDRPVKITYAAIETADGEVVHPTEEICYDSFKTTECEKIEAEPIPLPEPLALPKFPQPVVQKKPLQHTTEIVKNNIGQWVEKKTYTTSDGSFSTIEYDAFDRPFNVSYFNAQGVLLRTKKFRFDASGNLVEEDGVRRTFNAKGRQTSQTQEGRTTYFEWNDEGFLQKVIKPDGVAVIRTYDEQGRVVRVFSSDNTVDDIFTYDEQGRIIAASNKEGLSIKRLFDGSGNLIQESFDGLILKNRFDKEGRRYELELFDTSTINYQWTDNQLKSVSRGGYRFSYDTMNASGKVLQCSLIGKLGKLERDVDDQGFLIAQRTPFQSETILRDASSNIVSIQRDDSTSSYSYEGILGLVEEEGMVNSSYREPRIEDLDFSGRVQAKENKLFSYDALDRLIEVTSPECFRVRYSYDPFGRKCARTEEIFDTEVNAWRFEKRERFLWDAMKEIAKVDDEENIQELRVLGVSHGADRGGAVMVELDGKLYQPLHNFRGDVTGLVDPVTKKIVFQAEYSAFGVAASVGSKTSPWLFASKRYDPLTGLVDFGKRHYDPQERSWMTPDALSFNDGPNTRVFCQNDPINRHDLYGNFSITETAESALSHLVKAYNFTQIMLRTIRYQFDWRTYIKPNLDEFGRAVLGRPVLHLAGFYNDKPASGKFGQGELSNKLRVTFINGMLNSRIDYRESLEAFSESHGGINIHYVFNPTRGWTWDLLKCLLAKCGFVTREARMLAQMWRQQIAEMGGVESGGTILHYCHSIGGTHTANAVGLMTAEELKMIHVVSIGSASLLDQSGFGKVTNYTSKRDGVSMLDPFRWIPAFRGTSTNTHLIGSFKGAPFVDHPLNMETYDQLIRELGHKMFENYL